MTEEGKERYYKKTQKDDYEEPKKKIVYVNKNKSNLGSTLAKGAAIVGGFLLAKHFINKTLNKVEDVTDDASESVNGIIKKVKAAFENLKGDGTVNDYTDKHADAIDAVFENIKNNKTVDSTISINIMDEAKAKVAMSTNKLFGKNVYQTNQVSIYKAKQTVDDVLNKIRINTNNEYIENGKNVINKLLNNVSTSVSPSYKSSSITDSIPNWFIKGKNGYFPTGILQHNKLLINERIVEDFLMHHGIKGQKWGIRKYQNEDGTLTDAGKARYRQNGEILDSTNATDEELRIATSRLNAEKNYELIAGTRTKSIAKNKDVYAKALVSLVGSSLLTLGTAYGALQYKDKIKGYGPDEEKLYDEFGKLTDKGKRATKAGLLFAGGAGVAAAIASLAKDFGGNAAPARKVGAFETIK